MRRKPWSHRTPLEEKIKKVHLLWHNLESGHVFLKGSSASDLRVRGCLNYQMLEMRQNEIGACFKWNRF